MTDIAQIIARLQATTKRGLVADMPVEVEPRDLRALLDEVDRLNNIAMDLQMLCDQQAIKITALSNDVHSLTGEASKYRNERDKARHYSDAMETKLSDMRDSIREMLDNASSLDDWHKYGEGYSELRRGLRNLLKD